MAILYGSGNWGVQSDEEKALAYVRLLAEKGRPDWQVTMGDYYRNGKVVRRSGRKALEWFTKAAEQGDEDAMLELGGLYCYGLGVKRDDKKGYEWIEKSESQSVLEYLKKTENNRGGFIAYSELPKGADPSEAW